jgi:hypothetical protein
MTLLPLKKRTPMPIRRGRSERPKLPWPQLKSEPHCEVTITLSRKR